MTSTNKFLARCAALAALALAGHAGLAADAASTLGLPAGTQAAWVLRPGKAMPASTRFDLDRQDNVWILPTPQVLTRVDGLGLMMREPVRDLVFVGGVLSLVSDAAAGRLVELRHGRQHAGQVERQVLLPGPGWRLADGGAAGAVAFGLDPDSGQSWLLRLKDRRKILALPQRVLAAQAVPGGWALSTPGGLLKISDDGKVTRLGLVPGGASSLAWVDGVGLVAAGPQGVALVGHGVAKPLLPAPQPRVRARGDALYVLVPSTGGILKITGLRAPAP